MAIGTQTAVELFSSLSELLRTTRAIGQRSRDFGATGTALGILRTLNHGDARPGDLAVGLHVVPSVISRTVVPLEHEGLVERKVDPDDARASLLGLTELGRNRLREVQQVYVQQLCQTLQSWDDDEAEEAARLLGRLEEALAGYRQPEIHRRQLSEALLPRSAAAAPGSSASTEEPDITEEPDTEEPETEDPVTIEEKAPA
jgi:DNA-binding MarR family transcriptional regulator